MVAILRQQAKKKVINNRPTIENLAQFLNYDHKQIWKIQCVVGDKTVCHYAIMNEKRLKHTGNQAVIGTYRTVNTIILQSAQSIVLRWCKSDRPKRAIDSHLLKWNIFPYIEFQGAFGRSSSLLNLTL
jgi:hypothetical protein